MATHCSSSDDTSDVESENDELQHNDVLQYSSDSEPPVYSPFSDSSYSEDISSDEILSNLQSVDVNEKDQELAEGDVSNCKFGFILVGDNLDKTIKPR